MSDFVKLNGYNVKDAEARAQLAEAKEQIDKKLNIKPCYVYAPFRSTEHQGDCTLIKCDNEIILIDFGAKEDANTVIAFMINHGLTKVTRCIISHYHSDHAGAYSEILTSNFIDFSDCVFYTHPRIDESKVTGNADYLNRESEVTRLITSLGHTIVYPINNTITAFNKYLSCRWLNTDISEWNFNNYYTDFTDSYGDIGSVTNMNNFSLVSEFIHGKNHLLFVGDLERLSEKVVEPYIDVTPILYKQEHHGVNEVANAEYVKKINPKFTIVEGIGFSSHFANNEMSLHLIKNRGNVYVQAQGHKDTIFLSDGYDISCIEGTENVINDNKSLIHDVTADNIDTIFDPGTYRMNGIRIEDVSSGALYGFMNVYTKGSFTIQDCVTVSGMRFLRSYSGSPVHWTAWNGGNVTGTAELDTTNVSSDSSNTVTWHKYGDLVYITGQVKTTAAPAGDFSSFTIANGLPGAKFFQRSNTIPNNVSSSQGPLNAVLTISDSGTLKIMPRGLACASKTFLIDFIYIAN